ncbi:MAG: hypothetical protein ABEH66_01665 [Halobacteriales archaeon]
MVEDRITDGRRIAELLASELDGRADGPLDRVKVVNADEDVTPSEDGTRAFDVAVGGSVLANAFVHPERASLSFSRGTDAVLEAAASEGVDTRREAPSTDTHVFVEDGAEVKRAVDVVIALVAALPD